MIVDEDLVYKTGRLGRHKTYNPVQPVIDTRCYQCNKEVSWHLIEVAEWLALGSFRLFPMQRNSVLGCTVCSDFIELSRNELQGILTLEHLTQDQACHLHQQVEHTIKTTQMTRHYKLQRQIFRSLAQ